jgi:hypothetical protein
METLHQCFKQHYISGGFFFNFFYYLFAYFGDNY